MPTLVSSTRESAGLRERKKQQTRLSIIDAATTLITEFGMEATTVDMIADRAGVSQRTFFNYFDTKAEALLARTVDALDGLADILRDRPPGENPLVAVRETMCRFAESSGPRIGQTGDVRSVVEANPALKTELDRVFAGLSSRLRSQLAARYPDDPESSTAAAAAVSLGLGLLGLAFADSANSPGPGISVQRLREYFDVFVRFPLSP